MGGPYPSEPDYVSCGDLEATIPSVLAVMMVLRQRNDSTLQTFY